MSDWLTGAKIKDLHGSRGNGPFGDCKGVILHVNVSGSNPLGTSPEWYASGTNVNRYSVTPNFQVHKDGTIWQFLPINWQPWCQADGNTHYAAIETGGNPDEPLTEAQLKSCAKILRAYHRQLDVPLKLANQPGERGVGTHQMGGSAWGGHACPGSIRSKQRADIIARTKALLDRPSPVAEPSTDDDPKYHLGRVVSALGEPRLVVRADKERIAVFIGDERIGFITLDKE